MQYVQCRFVYAKFANVHNILYNIGALAKDEHVERLANVRWLYRSEITDQNNFHVVTHQQQNYYFIIDYAKNYYHNHVADCGNDRILT